MKKLITYSCNHAVPFLIIFVLLTIIFTVFALRIEIDSDITHIMPEDDEVGELIQKYSQESDQIGSMILAVESDNPYTLEKMNVLYDAIQEIEDLPGVISATSIFNFLTFRNNEGRISIGYFLDEPRAPKTAEELVRFKEALLADPFARNQIITEDGKVISVLFPLSDTTNETTVREVRRIKNALGDYFNVYVTGDNFFAIQTTEYLVKDLAVLLSMAAGVIILFYYLGFRSKRAIFLPLCVIIMGLLWTLGFMKLLNFHLTLISIILPPLLLTIGSSYTIHVLNAFYRGAKTDIETKEWIIDAVTQVTRTIILAGLTTIAGFASLMLTSLDQTRQFGLSMCFGILTCVVFSLFFFPAALTVMTPPKEYQRKHVMEGLVTRIMERLSLVTLKTKYLFILIFILTLVIFIFSVPNLKRQTDYLEYFPENDRLIEDTKYLISRLGGTEMMNVTFTAPGGEKNYFLKSEILTDLFTFEEAILSNENVLSTMSFTNYLRGLNSIVFGEEGLPERRGLILTLARYFKLLTAQDQGNSISYLANSDLSRITFAFRVYDKATGKYMTEEGVASLIEFFNKTIDETLGDTLEYELWDPSLRYLNLSRIMNRDQIISIAVSAVIIFLISSLFFHSAVYGFLSLIPVVFGVAINFICMVVMDIPLDMITIMVSSVTIGVGVDDSIHFLLQFRRQLSIRDGKLREVYFHTYSIAGRPILLTTITIIGGLAVLVASRFKAIGYFGILICITLASAFMGTIFILPSFARIFLRRSMK